jgi:hypothetical protein
VVRHAHADDAAADNDDLVAIPHVAAPGDECVRRVYSAASAAPPPEVTRGHRSPPRAPVRSRGACRPTAARVRTRRRP